jgi:hypothetical protein
MLNFFSLFTRPPRLHGLPFKPYRIYFALDRLACGVDNIHIDVHVSPQLRNVLKKTASLVLVKHTHTDYYFQDYKRDLCESEKDILRNLCTEILQHAINRAKTEAEPQIDYLGQVALAKMFLEEVRIQYRNLVENFEQRIRSYQLSSRQGDVAGFRTREKLAEIKLNQNRILRQAGKELFQILTEVQIRHLRNIRETHFSTGQILPGIFFNNPVLHTGSTSDDFFLIEEYVLLGKRSRDPDNYNNVKRILYDLLARTDLTRGAAEPASAPGPRDPAQGEKERMYDPWIMETRNIDILFDVFDAQSRLEDARSSGESEERLRQIGEEIKTRQFFLSYFYRAFKKSGLMKKIMASFEIKPIYGIYCPPMAPGQIRDYLVDFWSRRSIKRQLKRRKSIQGGDFPLAPLQQAVRWIKTAPVSERKKHLLNFLRQFARYHRDLYNAMLLNNAMEAILLATDEKTLQLSRGNRSLYEFLLPQERLTEEEKPVSNHVILKADIRGSIQINHIMRTRGLNPASHFSLNFFDPISEILWIYDAFKVFIEGDAIILAIFENENTPEGWYSVARACGLAIRILQIVQRYNVKNEENNLPILELGIGIAESAGPPFYLFDGDSRIMISPAINMADRLSACNRKLRRHYANEALPHNLYVFKNAREDVDDTVDDVSLRYNVNGIELSQDSFDKLSREIKLKKVDCKAGRGEGVQFYAGKVPLLNGHFQQLVIRESPVYEIDPESYGITRPTLRKYYEVCTSQEIYDSVNGG